MQLFGIMCDDSINKYKEKIPLSTMCILRSSAAGFAEQNGRNAELKRPECGLVTTGANS